MGTLLHKNWLGNHGEKAKLAVQNLIKIRRSQFLQIILRTNSVAKDSPSQGYTRWQRKASVPLRRSLKRLQKKKLELPKRLQHDKQNLKSEGCAILLTRIPILPLTKLKIQTRYRYQIDRCTYTVEV